MNVIGDASPDSAEKVTGAPAWTVAPSAGLNNLAYSSTTWFDSFSLRHTNPGGGSAGAPAVYACAGTAMTAIAQPKTPSATSRPTPQDRLILILILRLYAGTRGYVACLSSSLLLLERVPDNSRLRPVFFNNHHDTSNVPQVISPAIINAASSDPPSTAKTIITPAAPAKTTSRRITFVPKLYMP